MKFLLLATTFLFMSSCATMNKEECQATDWYAKGITDGAGGKSAEEYQKYSKACTEHGITPDFAQYSKGRDKGLLQFCEDAGTQLGSQGETITYPKQCLSDNHKRVFGTGHVQGLVRYCSYEKGLSEGSQGERDRSEICPEKSRVTFKKGYDKGIRQYCAPARAFQMERGGKNPSVSNCPRSMRARFEDAVRDAQRVKLLEGRVSSLKEQRDRHRKILETTTSEVERVRAEYAIRDVNREIDASESEIRNIERDY